MKDVKVRFKCSFYKYDDVKDMFVSIVDVALDARLPKTKISSFLKFI